MSDTTETETETDTNTDTTDEPSKAELHDRVKQLESTVEKLMPSRRDALKFGAAGIAGAAGLGAATQPAEASTGSAGVIGSTSDRPDLIADDVAPRSIADDYLYAGEFSGSDPDTRLDNCLNAASKGTTIYLEAGDYTRNRTISTQGLDIIGAGGNRDGTGISATITLDNNTQHMRHLALRDSNLNGGEIILNGGEFARHLVMGTLFGDVTINSGTQKSIVALTRDSNVTDNGTNNQLVGNI